MHPFGFHAANLLLHICSTFLVFAIVKRITSKPWPAAVGALLFAIHPIQVECVAWVTAGKDLLCGCLSLASVMLYVKGRDGTRDENRARYGLLYGAALVLFLLALLAKPTAACVPLVIFVMDAWLLRQGPKRAGARLWPWFAVAFAYAIFTKGTQPDAEIQHVAAMFVRPMIAADAVAFYLGKLLLPFRFAADYGRTPSSVMSSPWFFKGGLLLALVLMAIGLTKHRRVGFACTGLFVMALSPTLGLIPFAFQTFSTVANRYVYFAMLGPAVASSCVIAAWSGRRRVHVAAAGILCVLGGLSMLGAQVWSNDFTLWTHTLEINPRSYTAHYNLAKNYSMKGDEETAAHHYKRALDVNPSYDRALNNLGLVLVSQGEMEEGIALYRRAIEAMPRNASAHNNLGLALASRGEREEAILQYRGALAVQPDYAEVHFNLANSLRETGDFETCIAHYRQAMRIQPSMALESLRNIGVALSAMGRHDQAIEHFEEALSIDPGYEEAHNDWGLALAAKGMLREAMEHYAKALAANPRFTAAHNNMGIAWARIGDHDRAISCFSRALAIDPNYRPAQQNLATAQGEKMRRRQGGSERATR